MNLYNEIDPRSAEWLRNLIAAGEIPEGIVDERSIVDLEPEYLNRFTQCHFFAGIGGWPYALRLAGVRPTERLWTGSCPCQPFSVAGKGAGVADERHLWPAFRWLISKCGPAIVFGEQVASADGREWASGVRDDLEVMGYDVGLADLCAPGVGADHIRQRLYWGAVRLADGGQPGLERHSGNGGDGDKPGRDGTFQTRHAPACGRVDWNLSVWWPCRDGKLRRVPARRVDHATMPRHESTGRGQPGEFKCGQCVPGLGCADGGLGNAENAGPSRTRGNMHVGGTITASENGGVGNPESQRGQVLLQPGQPGRPFPDAGRGGGPCGISDTANDRQPRQCAAWGRRAGTVHVGGPVHAPGHDRLEVEPRLFPLADGVSGGVVVECAATGETREINRRAALFGAGNAIVPQLAAEFITAFNESAFLTESH